MAPSSPLAGRLRATGALLAGIASKCLGSACTVALIAQRHLSRAALAGEEPASRRDAPNPVDEGAEAFAEACLMTTRPGVAAVGVAGTDIISDAVSAGVSCLNTGFREIRMLEARESIADAVRSSRHRCGGAGIAFVRRTSAWHSTMI